MPTKRHLLHVSMHGKTHNVCVSFYFMYAILKISLHIVFIKNYFWYTFLCKRIIFSRKGGGKYGTKKSEESKKNKESREKENCKKESREENHKEKSTPKKIICFQSSIRNSTWQNMHKCCCFYGY